MPILVAVVYRLSWPVYADPRVAGLCRSLTGCRPASASGCVPRASSDELSHIVNAFDPWGRDHGECHGLDWQTRTGTESDTGFKQP